MSVTSFGPDQESGTQPPRLAVLDDGRQTFAILAALFLASVALQFALPMNHDAAWYLHAAKAFIEGGTLYDDIYLEMNLPLPLLLALPPVAFSEASGLFVVSAFRVYVFAWILFSCWLSWRLLESLVAARQRRGLMIFLLGAVGLLAADHFGQREHYLIIAILPYLILAARRAEGLPFGPGGAVFVGIHAAVGFALKPHFLLVLLAVEAYLSWRNRNLLRVFRPETLGLGITGLAYFALVVLLTPAFFTFIAPMAVDLYHAYNKPLLGVAVVVPLPILGFALLIHLRGRHALNKAALADILCLTALCLFTIYLVQRKGWTYHLYPTTACLVMYLGAVIFAEGRPEAARGPAQAGSPSLKSARRAAALAILILVGSSAAQGFIAIRDQRSYLTNMVPALRQHAENGTFHFLTTSLSASFPLTHYSGVSFVSRFPMLWPIAGLQSYRQGSSEPLSPERRERLETYERYVIDSVVADLTRSRPKVVIVDERPEKPFIRKLEVHYADFDIEQEYYEFDYIEFFSADPRFARFWSDYEVVDRLGYFTIFARR